MPDLFQTIDVGVNAGDKPNGWYGVFIVSPTNPKDRYLLTSPSDKKDYATKLRTEFTRLLIENLRKDSEV